MRKPDCEQLEDCQIITDNANLYDWLQAKAKKKHLTYLLAHAEDGVIWGHFNNGELVTSRDVFPQFAELRLCTLQQCRIFGEKAEVMLWKVGQNWKARIIKDDNNTESIPDEHQILWGTQVEKESNGFTLVSDGSQGLKHAVPLTGITFKGKDSRPLRLKVRHYIDYDKDNGVAIIYLSRLVKLDSNGKS